MCSLLLICTSLFGVDWTAITTYFDQTDSSGQKFAVSGTGYGVAAWIDTDDTVVKASIYNPTTGSATTPVTISSSGTLSGISVAVNASGEAVVVWESVVSSAAHMFASVYTNGSWSSEEDLGTGGAANSTMTAAAIDDDGRAIALLSFIVNRNSYTLNAFNYTGSWSAATELASGLQTGNFATIYMDPSSGNGIAAWIEGTGGAAAIYTPTGGWESSLTVATASTDSEGYRGAINASGQALVGFYFNAKGTKTARVSIYNTTTDTWGTATELGSISDDTFTRVAINASGEMVTLFTTPSFAVQASRYTTSWSSAETLSASGSFLDYSVSIAPNGNAVALFGALTSTPILSAAVYQNGAWEDAQVVSGSTDESGSKGSVYALSSGPYIFWGYVSGANWLAEVRRFIATTMTISGSRTSNRYATQTLFKNELSWSLSSTDSVSAIWVFRDGILIAKLDSTATSYSDPKRIKGQKYSYSVRAQDSTGTVLASSFIVL
ncbi:MAG: hypothetical protein SP1CHLAM54_04010 [Chlamydiia bacterium]|nr:hypothetical protein [Chlamydiia bacterium]MCH9615316.1 hypothetical protein [Chlamydiia bacterium]MCH9628362.1 hypothetical protein [Chlamydiia bacterium]